MKKEDLEVGKIYRLQTKTDGLKIAVIQSNRCNPKKHREMLKGCRSVGQQQPGIFIDAKLASEAGYTLIDVEDSHVVTKAEVADYVVVFDGNNRYHAHLLGLKENTPFVYSFHYVEFPDAATFKKAYHEINIYNTPTNTVDFARDFQATSNNPVIASYREKISIGLVPKAAGFATIGREILKKDLNLLVKGEIPAGFNDKENLIRFSRIFESMKSLVERDTKVYRGTEIWSWISAKMAAAEDKDAMVSIIVGMFEGLSYLKGLRLKSAKATGNKPKATVVKEILDEIFKEMKKS